MDSDASHLPVSAVQPLVGLSHLTDLAICHAADSPCMEVLRSVHQLRRLNPLLVWTPDQLHRLVSGPMPPLEYLGSLNGIDHEIALSLSRVTTLVVLTPSVRSIADPGLVLAHLPSLRCLQMTCEPEVPVDIDCCIHTRMHGTQLMALTLSHGQLVDDHLCALVPCLVHLTHLDLRCLIDDAAMPRHTTSQHDTREVNIARK
jgi:hypothetical protein